MKPLLLIFFSLFLSFCFAQQNEQIFIVKKRTVENKNGFPKILDLKLGAVGDTICGSVRMDLSPAMGYFDSISVVNLRIMDRAMLYQTRRWYVTTSNSGHAIITFYKKEKDGSYKMVYFRNWVIHCSDKYSK